MLQMLGFVIVGENKIPNARIDTNTVPSEKQEKEQVSTSEHTQFFPGTLYTKPLHDEEEKCKKKEKEKKKKMHLQKHNNGKSFPFHVFLFFLFISSIDVLFFAVITTTEQFPVLGLVLVQAMAVRPSLQCSCLGGTLPHIVHKELQQLPSEYKAQQFPVK